MSPLEALDWAFVIIIISFGVAVGIGLIGIGVSFFRNVAYGDKEKDKAEDNEK